MGEKEKADTNRAFSEGSDARLKGLPRSANPYAPKVSNNPLYLAWQRGWDDVSKKWGVRVRNRWSFPPLPPLVNEE